MPPVNAETIPGSVALPTWVLIAAIVVVSLALVWAVKRLIDFGPLLMTALGMNTEALKENTEALRRLEK